MLKSLQSILPIISGLSQKISAATLTLRRCIFRSISGPIFIRERNFPLLCITHIKVTPEARSSHLWGLIYETLSVLQEASVYKWKCSQLVWADLFRALKLCVSWGPGVNLMITIFAWFTDILQQNGAFLKRQCFDNFLGIISSILHQNGQVYFFEKKQCF
jgi:hypothetical protein